MVPNACIYVRGDVTAAMQQHLAQRSFAMFGTGEVIRLKLVDEAKRLWAAQLMDPWQHEDGSEWHWPGIYTRILLVRDCCPGLQIDYGHDAIESATACTPEFLAWMWATWSTTSRDGGT